jgi:hypothetical protein
MDLSLRIGPQIDQLNTFYRRKPGRVGNNAVAAMESLSVILKGESPDFRLIADHTQFLTQDHATYFLCIQRAIELAYWYPRNF